MRGLHALGVALCIGGSCPAQALSLVEMRQRTVDIANRYLAIWSSNDGAAIGGVPYMYGPTVSFYGRTITQDQLLAEKRRAIRQWPVRRYANRPGTLRVSCNPAGLRCAARSTMDFEVANPDRGTGRRGSARFDLGVSFAGDRPRILYEGGSLSGRRVH